MDPCSRLTPAFRNADLVGSFVIPVFWLDVGPHQAHTCPLEIHTELFNLGWVKVSAGGVIAIRVNSQKLSNIGCCFVVPVNFSAIGHLVLFVELLGG